MVYMETGKTPKGPALNTNGTERGSLGCVPVPLGYSL